MSDGTHAPAASGVVLLDAADADRLPAAAGDSEIVRVYVWQVPVRVTHWLIAGSIVVLSATGFYIGRPFVTVTGPAGQSFLMGWVKIVHLYAALVFITAVVVRVIWMFTGNQYARWDKFLPVHASRRRGLLPTLRFYTFLDRDPPAYVGHNPVAGAAYVAVFGLYALAIATGLVMWGASATVGSPLGVFGGWAPLFGGLQTARWIHHLVMWLLLGFAAHHVYSAVLVASVEKTGTIDSIVSGYKWVTRRALGPGPFRRVHDGRVDE
jgi:Ni/Fe-hydrogenase 1 B-type cytochrome subunit